MRFTGEIPDPIARALNGLLDEVTSLRARVAELERERGAVHGGSPAATDLPLEPLRGDGADESERELLRIEP